MKIKLISTSLEDGKAFYYPTDISQSGNIQYHGTLDIGGMLGDLKGIGLAGHEMFHAFEDISGRPMHTVVSETSALLFAARVEYMKDMYDGPGKVWPSFGTYTVDDAGVKVYTSGESGAGQEFQSKMIDVVKHGVTADNLNYLVDRFKNGSWANRNLPGGQPGAYNDYDRGTVNVQDGNLQEQIAEFLK